MQALPTPKIKKLHKGGHGPLQKDRCGVALSDNDNLHQFAL